MKKLRGVCVGAGYFSQFHYDAWDRIDDIEIVAACDIDAERIGQVAGTYGIPATYTNVVELLDETQPDFIDIITPPQTHADIVAAAAERGIDVICQKPLAPTFEDAAALVKVAETAGIRFMVHENFRFQPWHREIKQLIDQGAIGDKLHTLTFRSRMGDGWGEDAYLGRQPYFREMGRLLIHETGVHFIDTLRYLGGEVTRVYAKLRKLNSVIAGEDCGLMMLDFDNDAIGIWDANRYNEPNNANSRYTFGEFLVEGNGGSIRLYCDGRLTVQPLGQTEETHDYHHVDHGFGGDCCYNTIRHFVDCLIDGDEFETNGRDYLRVLEIQEAVYRSADTKLPVDVPTK